MKRSVLIFLSLALMLGLAACAAAPAGGRSSTSGDPANGAKGALFSGKIMQLAGGSALIADTDPEQGGLYTLPLSGLEITDMQDAAIEAGALQAGMLVDISFDGAVMESFPAQFVKPEKLRVTGLSDDLAGFYLSVVRDLYEADPGLGGDISMLAFDLEEAANLTVSEKSALVYMAQNEFNLQTVSATFDELCKSGLIDEEALYFKTGLLFDFSDMTIGSDRFTFTASMWRSGLGAYFFGDCTALRGAGRWTYTVGREMIS